MCRSPLIGFLIQLNILIRQETFRLITGPDTQLTEKWLLQKDKMAVSENFHNSFSLFRHQVEILNVQPVNLFSILINHIFD